MQDLLFSNLFNKTAETTISPISFMVSVGVALILGMIIALAYSYKTVHTKEFMVNFSGFTSSCRVGHIFSKW